MMNRCCLALGLVFASSLASAVPFRVTLPPYPSGAGGFTGVNDVHVIFNEDLSSLIFVSDLFPASGRGFSKGAKSVDIWWNNAVTDTGDRAFFDVGTTTSPTLTVASAYWTLHTPVAGVPYVPNPNDKIRDIATADITIGPVPEPSAWIALACGAVALLRRRRA